jgi:hypothetical protein
VPRQCLARRRFGSSANLNIFRPHPKSKAPALFSLPAHSEKSLLVSRSI